jgi:hypothetical protein
MAPFLLSQCARLDPRIEREIVRLRARYELSLDEFRGLYISDEQIDRLLADAAAPGIPDVALGMPRPAAGASAADPRWQHMVRAFDLSPLEEDLLLIAAAPECDPKYETLYAYLNNDVTRKWPTADLARRLLADVTDTGAILAVLASNSPLQLHRLIDWIDAPSVRPAALNAGFALHPCLTQWLHGSAPGLALDHAAMTWLPHAKVPAPGPGRSRAEPIARLLASASSRSGAVPIVGLLGPSGSGRLSTAFAAAAATGRDLVRLDLRALPDGEAEIDRALDALLLTLALEPAVVLIEGIGALAIEDPHRSRRLSALLRAVTRCPTALVVLRTSSDEPWRLVGESRRMVEVRCDVATYAERVVWWHDAVRAEGLDVAEHEVHDLAGRFMLTPGQVRATLATAGDLVAMTAGGKVRVAEIAAAARLGSDQGLDRLATKVQRMHDWPDLVLPQLTKQRLRDLAAAIRQRYVVYDEWGFSERIAGSVGIRALFAGASGTGKTMAAGVIARELGLDLYKIDLSGVVSKYIGETEKNLDRIFTAARRANAIVFLDEAEALLGKRSEVKDAHDRYANIEIAYLLQKLEDHDGIVMLATNLKHNIDDAFSRRMQYVIDFPRPDESERERIWRGMFPSRAPLDGEVDFRFLAKHFDLAGGDIRNVVLDAAFLTAQDGGVIGMGAIVEALARQLAKQGKTPTGSEFRQYQGLLPTAGR